jgi:hypothetical protein
MKIKKITMMVVSAMLLVTLIGCLGLSVGETDNNRENEGRAVSSYPLGISIRNNGDTNFKNELIEQIETSRNAVTNDSSYWLYSNNRISDITEFYFPELEFDGFELAFAEITSSIFGFYYAPIGQVEESLNSPGHYLFDEGIQLSIVRTDAVVDDMLSSPTLSQLAAKLNGTIKDGFVYIESKYHNEIAGVIDDTWFFMYYPDELNDFKVLKEISRQLVETAELINVDKEIKRIASELTS